MNFTAPLKANSIKIQLKCGDWSIFYAKDIGKIAGQNISSFIIDDITTTNYSISVYNPNS
jgi:hypothetical protein